MRRHDIPILEFDDSPNALIEPAEILRPIALPDRCVLCFFQDVIASLREAGRLKVVAELGSEIGRNPIYTLDTERGPLTVFHPGVGAPLAAAFLEELIALGGRRFIACGGCGALDPSLVAGHVVVPVSAVRDEGTSYHYLPPSREVEASPVAVTAIESVLREHAIEYVLGKTWTTDAIYRETPARIARRREEGCITVEMEAAAFFAVAHFRDVSFGQILYSGDDLTGEVWDGRGWHGLTTTRDKLFWLAAEACLAL